jgi:hypothetical protein
MPVLRSIVPRVLCSTVLLLCCAACIAANFTDLSKDTKI